MLQGLKAYLARPERIPVVVWRILSVFAAVVLIVGIALRDWSDTLLFFVTCCAFMFVIRATYGNPDWRR